jgi:hypothetical protein
VGQNPATFDLVHEVLARDYQVIGKVNLRLRGYFVWVRRAADQGAAFSGARTRPIRHR